MNERPERLEKAMVKYQEITTLTSEHVDAVHDVFKSVVASAIMQDLMARIEADKKDVDALSSAIDMMKKTDVVLPAFSGAKRKDWQKQLKKAKNKAEGKETKKKDKKKDKGDKKKKKKKDKE